MILCRNGLEKLPFKLLNEPMFLQHAVDHRGRRPHRRRDDQVGRLAGHCHGLVRPRHLVAQPEQVAGQDEVDPGPVQRQRGHRHPLHPNAQNTQVRGKPS